MQLVVRSMENKVESQRKKIVVIGGGTGTFTVLSGLKKHPIDLTAIVTTADDGGSTGRLRDEFGVLPPGDMRQCLVALSRADLLMRRLFMHRFDRGDLRGHSFGNIFIATIEHVAGNIDTALDVAGRVLNIEGSVVPVTREKVKLVAHFADGTTIEGEDAIGESRRPSEVGITRLALRPDVRANPKALRAIRGADMIVVGPGDLYTSLLPNLLVRGVTTAILKSAARKVFVANLMNRVGHADGFTVFDYVRKMEELAGGKRIFDTVIYNTKRPPAYLLRKYAEEGAPVLAGNNGANRRVDFVGAPLLANGTHRRIKGDTLRRTLIRHDSDKLAKLLVRLLG